MEGGIQVNTDGRRFYNEALGYSEAAAQVLRQPRGIAFDIFDERIAGIACQFQDYQEAEKAGAVIEAGTLDDLAHAIVVPADALRAELDQLSGEDRFGRQHDPAKALRRPQLSSFLLSFRASRNPLKICPAATPRVLWRSEWHQSRASHRFLWR